MKKRILNYLILLIFAIFTLTTCDSSTSSSKDDGGTTSTLTDEQSVNADKDSLTLDSISFASGDDATSITQDFTLPLTGENGSTITYVFTPSGILSIDSDGKVTVTRPANGSEDVIVSCTATFSKGDESVTKDFSFTILELPDTTVYVSSVSLDKSSTTIMVGNTEQLTETVLPENATDKSVTWSSDDSNIATVSTTGLVTAEAAGSTTITAETTDGTKTANCTIKVTLTGKKYINTVNGVNFTMVYVSEGLSFKTKEDDSGTDSVANPYLIGETEVTFELWNEVYTWATTNGYTFSHAGVKGKDGTGSDQEPVTTINWRDVVIWTNALTEYYNNQNGSSLDLVYYSDTTYTTPIKTATDSSTITNTTAGSQDKPYIKASTTGNTDVANSTAKGFRLPSMTEWSAASRYKGDDSSNGAYEYPSSSGIYWTPGDYASGATADYNDASATGDVAWYFDNSGATTQVIKGKVANALGLYDMSGNVTEWNFDWDPAFPSNYRMGRGGSWASIDSALRVGYWGGSYDPYNVSNSRGIRLSRTP